MSARSTIKFGHMKPWIWNVDMNSDEYEIEKLQRRQSRLELLVASLIASAGEVPDPDSLFLLRRIFRRDDRSDRKFDADFEFLLDHLISRAGTPHLRDLEKRVAELQSDTDEKWYKFSN